MNDEPAPHLDLLERVLRLSVENVELGGGPFAALIVRSGQVLATGANRVTLDNDPSAHAEIVAIRRACQVSRDFSLVGATLYSSCEPCPMCFAAIHWARLERVYFAATRHDAARAGFDDALLYAELANPAGPSSVPRIHVVTPGANAAFDLWSLKTDRVPY